MNARVAMPAAPAIGKFRIARVPGSYPPVYEGTVEVWGFSYALRGHPDTMDGILGVAGEVLNDTSTAPAKPVASE